ncbi:MAG TPA: hypothetical protein VEH83_05070 [Gemmatimonadales bacterium]|nr:hypothetical protein [Gemmatimonadales bacterium]
MARAVATAGALWVLAALVGGRPSTTMAQAPLADSDLVVAGVFQARLFTVGLRDSGSGPGDVVVEAQDGRVSAIGVGLLRSPTVVR